MTSPPETLSPESQNFLVAVRRHLCDLPVPDQADLIEQVEQRLRDLDASRDPRAIQAHLGEAAEVAADLRTAAGFAAAPALIESSPRADSSAEILRAVARYRAVRPVIDYLVSLRPAWWAIRGYILLGGFLAAISHGGGYRLHTIGSYTQALTGTASSHASPAWLLPPAGAIVASIALGAATARFYPAIRLLVTALNLGAIALLIAYPTWWLAPAFAYYAGLAR